MSVILREVVDNAYLVMAHKCISGGDSKGSTQLAITQH